MKKQRQMSAQKSNLTFLSAIVLCAASACAQTNTGTIKGRIHLVGPPPGNPIIRMGVDPMCSQMNAGKRVIQPIVSTDGHGNISNVFVRVMGSFPRTPVPSQSVTIDQRSCMFTPRVVGVRVGQTLEVRNEDPIAHDVHSLSKGADGFNVTTPSNGAPFRFKPRQEEVMLRIACDVHRWMTAYVGVATNPYFAVSGEGGTFEIDYVPAGTYTIESWQERYGLLRKSVKVTSAATATIDFTYIGNEKLPQP